jgi:lipopolysaccharide/colanic/teichoic acid biosynthesis glycosyltransferase
MLKRLIDIIFGLIGLLIFIILFPFIYLFILFDSGFPILIGLERISVGKKIKVWKFRSMVLDAQFRKSELQALNERSGGPFFKIKNDPRVTKSGRVLRKYLLDELPQFWNVLVGELSLVGPRPHEPGEVEKYPSKYQHIPLVKAGLTGLSQVSGASELSAEREMELDNFYIKNFSLKLDFKIIFKTLFIFVFEHKGV